MASTAQNTIYLFISHIYQKLIAFIYFLLLARYLTVENFGKLAFVLSFVGIFSILIDFGLGPVLTREIARDKEKTKEYLGNILGFKLFSSIITFALVIFIINILNYSFIIKNLIYLAGFSMIFSSFTGSFLQTLRGFFNFKYEAIGMMIHQTVVLIIGIILMSLGAGVVLMLMPYIFGQLVYLVISLAFLKRKICFFPRFIFNWQIIKKLLKGSFPFFIAGAFTALYINIDTVILSNLTNDQFVGLYSVAKKLPNALLVLIPAVFSGAIYPVLSRHFVQSQSNLSNVFQEATFYIVLITLPIFFGALVLAKPIIVLFFGINYLPAVSALKILTLAIPFTFLDMIMVSLLNACNRQKINMINQGIGLIIIIIASIILIPFYQYKGAAIAFFISYLIIFGLEFYWALKLVDFDKRYLIKKTGGSLFASLIMAGIILFFREKVHLAFLILIGMIVYSVAIYLIGVLKREDIARIKNLILPLKPLV